MFEQQSLIELAPVCSEMGSYAAHASPAIVGGRMHLAHGSTLHQQEELKIFPSLVHPSLCHQAIT